MKHPRKGMLMLKLTSVCPTEGLVTLHSFWEGGMAFVMMFVWRYLRDIDRACRDIGFVVDLAVLL